MAAFWPIGTAQIIRIVSYPIRKKSRFWHFYMDPTKKCIMPSSRERHKGIIGWGHDLRLGTWGNFEQGPATKTKIDERVGTKHCPFYNGGFSRWWQKWLFLDLSWTIKHIDWRGSKSKKKIINRTFSFYFHSFYSFWCIKCVKRCDINFYM